MFKLQISSIFNFDLHTKVESVAHKVLRFFPLNVLTENRTGLKFSYFTNFNFRFSDEVTEPSNNSLPAALAPLSPSPEQSNSVSGLDRDVVMRSENAR